MSNETDRAIRDGDVFRWRFRDHDYSHGGPDPYWCCSCFAVAVKGRLVDTYWGLTGGDHKSFASDDPKLDIDFLGNLSDYDIRKPYEGHYYESADILDLRHGNNSTSFYVRKGAARNREAMIEAASSKLEKAKRDIGLAEHNEKNARDLLEKLTSGAALDGIWL